MRRRNGAVAGALVFTQFLEGLRSVNQLHLALAVGGFLVGEQPHIGGNASVIEDVVGQLDNGIHQIVFDQIATDVALAAARIAREERRTIVNGGHTAALGLVFQRFHLIHLFQEEQQLTVGSSRSGVEHFHLASEIGQRQLETVVEQGLLVVNLLLVSFP